MLLCVMLVLGRFTIHSSRGLFKSDRTVGSYCASVLPSMTVWGHSAGHSAGQTINRGVIGIRQV